MIFGADDDDDDDDVGPLVSVTLAADDGIDESEVYMMMWVNVVYGVETEWMFRMKRLM